MEMIERHGHTEGMTIRTYNNQSRQWSIYWSSQPRPTKQRVAPLGAASGLEPSQRG